LLLLSILALLLGGCISNTSTAPPTPTSAPTPSPVGVLPTETPTAGALISTDALPSPSPATEPAATPTTDPVHLLQGRRIGLDPGHGPREDLGAVLVNQDTGKLILSEDELNLDIALRARDILTGKGAEVVLTRLTRDEFITPAPADVNEDGKEDTEADDLQHRIDILNAENVDVFLSIHANSSGNPAKRKGIQALYCATDDCAFPQQNKRLGALVLDHLDAGLTAVGFPPTKRELRSDFWADSPDVPPGHLFMLGPATGPRHPRASEMPGIIIEALYVTSPGEAALLNRDDVRQAIAQSYADALIEYFTVRAP
jgi:N-acetylmuramoyl-L-alanine amidase